MSATLLLAYHLKQPGRLTIQLRGDEPASLLVFLFALRQRGEHSPNLLLRLSRMTAVSRLF